MAKASDLTSYLDKSGVEYRLLQHDPAFTAHEVARATHVADTILAKSIVVFADGQFVMAVLRADQVVDLHRLKAALGAKNIQLAREPDLEALFPDCQTGAMPPFGNLYGLQVVVDAKLTEDEDIVFNACMHTRAVMMKFADYRRIVQPLVAGFATAPFVASDQELL